MAVSSRIVLTLQYCALAILFAGIGTLGLALERHPDENTSKILTALLVILGIVLVLQVIITINKVSFFGHLKASERNIAADENRFKTLVGALREGILQYDLEGNILFCNDGFCTLTGYSQQELINANILKLFIKEEDWVKYKQRYRERSEGKYEEYEDSIRTKSGDYKFVSISASPIFDANGHPSTSMATVVDITERKKQMEDLEAFSASAAHDINAPLARIEMIASLVTDEVEGKLEPETMELMQAITGITYSMRAMLKDLLDFSRLGISGISRNKVDTNAVVKEVLESCKDINPKAKVILHTLPELHGDAILFRQVFVNLIGNALKYSSHKEAPVVEIGAYKDGNSNVIFVKDNGAGFSMEYYPKLFAAFQRLHVEFEGNGLGLPIVKRIIEKHGGKIWAEGIEGEGATFYFTIP